MSACRSSTLPRYLHVMSLEARSNLFFFLQITHLSNMPSASSPRSKLPPDNDPVSELQGGYADPSPSSPAPDARPQRLRFSTGAAGEKRSAEEDRSNKVEGCPSPPKKLISRPNTSRPSATVQSTGGYSNAADSVSVPSTTPRVATLPTPAAAVTNFLVTPSPETLGVAIETTARSVAAASSNASTAAPPGIQQGSDGTPAWTTILCCVRQRLPSELSPMYCWLE